MNRLKFLLFGVLLVLITSTKLTAQRSLSLEEFIAIALEKNYSIRIIENEQGIAGNNYSRGNAGLLPSLDLNSSFSGNLNNYNQNDYDSTENNMRSIHNTNTFAGLQAKWMLFEGFRGKYRYKQLGELKELADLNTRISVENMVAQLASEYYFYIQQKQMFSNLQYGVDLSRERVRIEQEHFLLGSGSKVQLLQAQVNLNADSSRLEKQYEVLNASQVRLSEIIADSDLNSVNIPEDTCIVVNPDLKYDELMDAVLTQNVAILTAQTNQNITAYDLDMTKAKRYPYINLNTGYGYNHNTYQSGTLENQQLWGMNYAITLGFSIYDGNNLRRQQENARIEMESSDLNIEQVMQSVKADFITIFNGYKNNLRLLELENQNLEVARENLDIAFERYRLGSLSGFELREVQKDLLEAEERLLSIQYHVKMAEISLMQISGKILDRLQF